MDKNKNNYMNRIKEYFKKMFEKDEPYVKFQLNLHTPEILFISGLIIFIIYIL